MENCRCTKESQIATLVTEVNNIKINMSENRELVIVVTKLVEQLAVTQIDVKDIKMDVKILKEKPMGIVSKGLWMIAGVVIAYVVNKTLGVI